MTGPFDAVADGIRFEFPPHLATFLRDVPEALATVRHGSDDPAARRLDVPVYPGDPSSDAEFWRWMRSELDDGRAEDRAVFASLVDRAEGGVVASRAEAEAFLRVLVEVRLALAARMGLEVEDDYERLAESEEYVLGLLAEVQVLLLRALSANA